MQKGFSLPVDLNYFPCTGLCTSCRAVFYSVLCTIKKIAFLYELLKPVSFFPPRCFGFSHKQEPLGIHLTPAPIFGYQASSMDDGVKLGLEILSEGLKAEIDRYYTKSKVSQLPQGHSSPPPNHGWFETWSL